MTNERFISVTIFYAKCLYMRPMFTNIC